MSASAMAPAGSPSTSTKTTVLPSADSASSALRSGDSMPCSREVARADHLDALPFDRALGALAGDGPEAPSTAQAAVRRRCRDPPGDRVLGVRLDRGGVVAAARLVDRPVRGCTTSVTPKRPSVSVPVLSKMTASMLRALSKAVRLRMSRPLRGRERGRDRDHQRDRQPEGVRAGDDHDRHRALQGEGELSPGQRQPGEQGERRRRPARRSSATGRPGRPGPGSGTCSPGPRRTSSITWERYESLAGLADLHRQGALAVDRPADHVGPRPACPPAWTRR